MIGRNLRGRSQFPWTTHENRGAPKQRRPRRPWQKKEVPTQKRRALLGYCATMAVVQSVLPLTLLCYGKCMHGNLASVLYNLSCEPTDAPQCVAFVVLAWLETEQDSAAILLLDISLAMLGFQNPDCMCRVGFASLRVRRGTDHQEARGTTGKNTTNPFQICSRGRVWKSRARSIIPEPRRQACQHHILMHKSQGN
jgi:hypothetical protein